MEALQASGKETERIKYHQGRAQGSIRDTMLLLTGTNGTEGISFGAEFEMSSNIQATKKIVLYLVSEPR